jgi:DUF1680 family protein
MIGMKDNFAVITDPRYSPFAHLKPVPINRITLNEGFWLDRIRTNHNQTILSQYKLLETTGRLDNFRRLTENIHSSYQGYVFNDSDVYKWLEAASWAMSSQHSIKLGQIVDEVINIVSRAQDRSGYLNTYFSLERTPERWSNLREKHELYCAGHLIQAAIAHFRVTGEHKLLDVAIKLADHIVFTFDAGKREGTSGHPEIEMALVELYRTTGDSKYLDLTLLFIDRRGHNLIGGSQYLVDHRPFRDLEYLAGHAVRALYLCSGATDVALETGEEALGSALYRLWKNMVDKQLYITGGVGARHEGEAFGKPYELPNARAYTETCAAIANVMWNWRMLQMDGEARYADLLEWALYNAVLPGISLDGLEYFYVNPLMNDGSHRRQEWFSCACCPPNVCRTLAMFPGYIYSISNEGIWLHLFANCMVKIDLANGFQVELEQSSSYPWDGKISLRINKMVPTNSDLPKQSPSDEFSFFLRIPGWLDDQSASVHINGENYPIQPVSGSYMEIRRSWKVGDKITLLLPMNVKYIESHPYILENTGRIAISRGPLLYCVEQADNPKIGLQDIKIITAAVCGEESDTNLLGGIVKLGFQGESIGVGSWWNGRLYNPIKRAKGHRRGKLAEIIAIPYYAWANREPGAMQIWHNHA